MFQLFFITSTLITISGHQLVRDRGVIVAVLSEIHRKIFSAHRSNVRSTCIASAATKPFTWPNQRFNINWKDLMSAEQCIYLPSQGQLLHFLLL